MDIELQKSELINWISRLKDHRIIREILHLKSRVEKKHHSAREFGSGKHIFTYVADDFNDPLDDFREYQP